MERSLFECLKSIVWYNGLYEFLKELKEDIIKCNDFSYSIIDKEYYQKYLEESDQVQFLYMIFVLLYGDYGTSPRSGFLYMRYKSQIIETIDKLTTLDGKFMWDKGED